MNNVKEGCILCRTNTEAKDILCCEGNYNKHNWKCGKRIKGRNVYETANAPAILVFKGYNADHDTTCKTISSSFKGSVDEEDTFFKTFFKEKLRLFGEERDHWNGNKGKEAFPKI